MKDCKWCNAIRAKNSVIGNKSRENYRCLLGHQLGSLRHQLSYPSVGQTRNNTFNGLDDP